MGVIHEGHIIVVANWNTLEVYVQSGERCGDYILPMERCQLEGEMNE